MDTFPNFAQAALPSIDVPSGSFSAVGGTMDTMETIEVASGLSMELKLAVAAIVVLATMLVLTMVSCPSPESSPSAAHAAQRTHLRRSTHTQCNRRRRRAPHYTYRARVRDVTRDVT